MLAILKRSLVATGLLASPILAQAADGDLILTAGWFHLMPQDHSQPLHTDLKVPLAGVPASLDSPGTGVSVSTSDTLALTGVYFFSEHIALELVLGLPAKFDLYGRGTVLPQASPVNIDLGAPQNNPIANARQYSPGLTLQYHFRDDSADFRPFVGLGLGYTWYGHIRFDPDFQRSLQGFGDLLATSSLQNTPSKISGSATGSISPVAVVAFTYRLSKHVALMASISDTLLKTTSSIRIESANGSLLSQSRSDMTLNPVVTALQLNWTICNHRSAD